MHTASSRPDSLGQPLLERSLPILVLERDVPLAAGVFLAKRSQAKPDYVQIIGGQQLLRVQHFNMSDRRLNVIAYEPLVERIVLARRVMQHTAVEWSAFVPQAAHGALRRRPAPSAAQQWSARSRRRQSVFPCLRS